MVITSAEAFAPATVANLGVGFDILGMAVDGPGDRVEAFWHDTPGVHILDIRGDGGRLPRDPAQNVASVAAQALLQHLGVTRGVGLVVHKGLPSSSGLGSSAASAVAAVVAVHALLGEPLQRAELLAACLEGEALVSGYHADNVAPALFGGITLCNGVIAERIHRLPVPDNLFVALVTPDVEVPTASARAVLPSMVALKQMVSQTGTLAELIYAIYAGDIALMARAMEADLIIEPARAHLMPRLDAVRKASHQAGALGMVISGAGPTLCAVCNSLRSAEQVAQVMQQTYSDAGIGSAIRAVPVLAEGATVLHRAMES